MSLTSVLTFLKDSADEIVESRRQDKFIAIFTTLSAVATGWTFAQYTIPRLIISLSLWLLTLISYIFKLRDINKERESDFDVIKWKFLERAYSDHMDIKHDVLVEESNFYHKSIWSAINSLIYFTKNYNPKTPQGEEMVNKLTNSIRDGAYGLITMRKKIHTPYKELITGDVKVEDVPLPDKDKKLKDEVEYVEKDIEEFEKNLGSMDDLKKKLHK